MMGITRLDVDPIKVYEYDVLMYLFAFSTRFIDISVTAVVFELWPIVTMFILARLYGRSVHPAIRSLG